MSDIPPTAPALPVSKSRVVYIYGLPDECGVVRYIGKSVLAERRWRQHCCAKDGRRAVDRWIVSLRERGIKPGFLVLEAVVEEGWEDAERRWIAHYRAAGTDLLNGTAGGGGCPVGFPLSDEQRSRIAEGNRRRWERDKKHKPETLEKLRQAAFAQEHLMHSDATKEKCRRLAFERAAAKNPLTINGETRSIGQWAAQAGISPSSLRDRLKNGWDPAEAVSTPALSRPLHPRSGMLGRHHSEEARAKLREALKGRKPPPVTPEGHARKVAAMSKAFEGFCDPNGESVGTIRNMKAFCLERGLSNAMMCMVYYGHNRSHHGWTNNRPEVLEATRQRDASITPRTCSEETRRKMSEAHKARRGR